MLLSEIQDSSLESRHRVQSTIWHLRLTSVVQQKGASATLDASHSTSLDFK